MLDMRALDTNSELSADDVQLLAALVARLEVAAIPATQPRLQAIEISTQFFDGKSVQWKGLTFEVSGRRNYDWNGWRLIVKQRTSTSVESWQERFSTVRRALHLPVKGQSKSADEADKAGAVLVAWDFDARLYQPRRKRHAER